MELQEPAEPEDGRAVGPIHRPHQRAIILVVVRRALVQFDGNR